LGLFPVAFSPNATPAWVPPPSGFGADTAANRGSRDPPSTGARGDRRCALPQCPERSRRAAPSIQRHEGKAVATADQMALAANTALLTARIVSLRNGFRSFWLDPSP